MQTRQKIIWKQEEATRTISRGKVKFSRKAAALMFGASKQTPVKGAGKLEPFILPSKYHLYFISPASRLRKTFTFQQPPSTKTFRIASITSGKVDQR